MLSINLPEDFDLKALASQVYEQQAREYYQRLPPPDPWLTIPEAAAYARLSEPHMRLLVLGRPYRAAKNGKPEQPAIAPKIPAGDTGFERGARVRQSAVDAYLTRHSYRKAA